MRSVFWSRRWLGVHVIVVAAILVQLRLGLWQWHRSQSPSGGIQNYAYAFQWPLFAVFTTYLWWKSMKIEAANNAAAAAGESPPVMAMSRLAEPAMPEPEISHVDGVRVGLSTDMGPVDETDDEVRIYNAYLASLHAKTVTLPRQSSPTS